MLTSTTFKQKSKNDYDRNKTCKNHQCLYHCNPPPTWYSVTLVSKQETTLPFDKIQTISSPSITPRMGARGHALRISPTLLDSPREITPPLRLSIVVEPFRCLGSLDERTRLLVLHCTLRKTLHLLRILFLFSGFPAFTFAFSGRVVAKQALGLRLIPAIHVVSHYTLRYRHSSAKFFSLRRSIISLIHGYG